MQPVVPFAEAGTQLHYGDATVAAHIVCWVADQAFRNPGHLFDAPIFYPREQALLNHTLLLVPSALGAPVWWISHNFALVYNFLLYLSTFLTLAAVYWAMRAFTPIRRWAAAAAAIAATITTDRYWHIVGHLGHLWGILYVLAFFAGWYLLARPRWTSGLAVAGILLLSLFTDFYMLIYSGFSLLFGLVTAFVVFRIRPRWNHVLWLAAAIVLFVVVSLPYVFPYARAAAQHPNERRNSLTFCEINAATPYGWLLPPYQPKRLVTRAGAFIGHRIGEKTHMEDCQFIGYVLLLFLAAESVRLAARIVRRRPLQPLDRFSLLALIFAALCVSLSFGPRILGIRGPFYYLYILVLQYSGFFRNPSRFAFLFEFLSAIPAAVFITAMASKWKWFAPALAVPLALAVYLEHRPIEIIGRMNLKTPEVIDLIDRFNRTDTEPFIVVPDPGNSLPGIWSYPGWRPVANGFRDCALFPDYPVFLQKIDDFPSTRALGAIDQLGIHWIVSIDPALTAKAKANRHLEVVDTRHDRSLLRLVDPGVPSAEWKAEWDKILQRVQAQRAGIPDGESQTVVLANFVPPDFSPFGKTNIEAQHVPGKGMRMTLLGTHISSFFIPVPERYQETLFDEIEVVFQGDDRYADAFVRLYWWPDQPWTEKTGQDGTIVAGDAPGQWIARFNLTENPFYYAESKITRLRFDFTLARPATRPEILVQGVRATRYARVPAQALHATSTEQDSP